MMSLHRYAGWGDGRDMGLLDRLSKIVAGQGRKTPSTLPEQLGVGWLADQNDPFVELHNWIAGQHKMLFGVYGDRLLFTPPDSHLLLMGPTRKGKTAGTLIPLVLAAEGPTVSTSVRKDVLRACAMARARKGTVWHLDLDTGVAERGTTPLRFSPITANFSKANAVAEAMCFAAEAGSSDSGGAPRNGAYFYAQAARLIGPTLVAAAIGHMSIEWVVDVVLSQTPDSYLPVVDVLSAHEDKPGVRNAKRELEGILAMSSSHGSANDIYATAARAFRVYNRPEIMALAEEPNFDPDAFVAGDDSTVNPAMFSELDASLAGSSPATIQERLPHSRYDTIFITANAENQKAVAPVIVGLLQALYQASARLREADESPNRYRRPMMTWALDEMASMAPWPDFPTLLTTAAGDGVLIAAVLHDLSFARAKWGEHSPGSLRNNMQTTIVYPGIQDPQTLRDLEQTLGYHLAIVKSRSSQQNRGTTGGPLLPQGNQGSSQGETESEQWLPWVDAGRISGGHPDDPTALLMIAPWLPGDGKFTYVSPTPYYDTLPWAEMLVSSTLWIYNNTNYGDPRRLLPIAELDRSGGKALYEYRSDEWTTELLEHYRWAQEQRAKELARAARP